MVDALAVPREPARAVHQPRRRPSRARPSRTAAADRARTRSTRRTTASTRAPRGRPARRGSPRRRPPRRRPRPRARARPGRATRSCRRSRCSRSGRRRSRRAARAPPPAPAGRGRAPARSATRRWPRARRRGSSRSCGRRRRRRSVPSACSARKLVERDVAAHQVVLPRPRRAAARSRRRSSPTRRGQRVWKTQPLGGFAALGMSPSSLIRSPLAAVDRRHGREQRLGVRVMRAVEHDVRRAELHQPAEVEHGDPVGDVAHDAEVVGDEEVRDALLAPAARRAG